MDSLIAWISAHGEHAHWFIFGALLLAGINIPLSADLLILASAVLAATLLPEHTIHLFLAVFLGCYFSAWIAYWMGRLLGNKLTRFRWFSKLLPPERIEKTKKFYHRFGFLTLLLGRFIPFGVRNCIFMTSGMSQMHFGKFILWDFFATLIWSSLSFYIYYKLGGHTQMCYDYLRTFNIVIFAALGVTLIGFIWYKRRKKTLTI